MFYYFALHETNLLSSAIIMGVWLQHIYSKSSLAELATLEYFVYRIYLWGRDLFRNACGSSVDKIAKIGIDVGVNDTVIYSPTVVIRV